MNAATTPLARRGSLAAAAVAVGLLAAMPGAGVAHAAPNVAGRGGGGTCPAAESLVPHTAWHKHTLAPGVTMSAGTAKDPHGTVNMHVLRVNLASKNVRIGPLVHSLAERSPLSTLVKGHPNLVAATNTGYFDFRSGAPTDPFISGGVPQVIASTHEVVVGLGTNNRMQSGHVWWSATLTAGKRKYPLVAKNETYPPVGIAVYNPSWGPSQVLPGRNSAVLTVVKGIATWAPPPRNRPEMDVPKGGFLLVSRGQAAANWLSAIPLGTKVTIASTVKTSAPKPFVQAYGVGVQVVTTPGVIRTGFTCHSANTETPARTEIGFANAGRTLIIAIVADDPFTSMHGLDEDQMSELMVQLGASQAFAFDGSGSTELLARLHPTSALTLQNYPADGQERVMPLGLGISSIPAKAKKKTKH